MLAVFPIPQQSKQLPTDTLAIALDGIQDPGNMGTIIRIADWFGIDTIYCSEDTVDAWSPKVVQATMGSIARVNIIYTDLGTLIDSTTLPVYGTLLDGNDIYKQPLTAEWNYRHGQRRKRHVAEHTGKVTTGCSYRPSARAMVPNR